MRCYLKPLRINAQQRCMGTLLSVAIATVPFLLMEGVALGSSIKSDEMVIFFPTSGHLDKQGETWVCPIHGWIFEPEKDSLKRRALLKVAAKTLGLETEGNERALFKERAAQFLVDNERDKTISFQIGPDTFKAGASGANGHFKGEVRLARTKAEALVKKNWLTLKAGKMKGVSGKDLFVGKVQLLAPVGVSVISDIDDTIKISNVLEKRDLLANTFLRPYRAAPGMAERYKGWARQGAAFHYVSSSPWQLYPALASFMKRAGFPGGSFHLRLFRAKDRSLANLLKSSEKTKPPEIEPLLKAFSKRRFILVGDSGEQDPEIYGQVARTFPKQILHIYIRDVLKEGMPKKRIEQCFKGVSADNWTVFKDPGRLPKDLPSTSR